jgi:hypothetical protein
VPVVDPFDVGGVGTGRERQRLWEVMPEGTGKGGGVRGDVEANV